MHDLTRHNLQTLMDAEGISERQLAFTCGINQSTLNRFMDGKTQSMELENLMALARHFDLTVSQLIGESPIEEDRKVRAVVLAMQAMPEYKKDALVAASNSLAQPDPPKAASGE